MLKKFLLEEDGISTVEIVFIILVLVSLIIIFKSRILGLLESIFKDITNKKKTLLP